MTEPAPALDLGLLEPAADEVVYTVPVDQLTPHPENPRRGNLPHIVDSLRAHGQYKPLIAQASTGVVLAGNHTLAAAVQLGWGTVRVLFRDVDDDEGRRILAVDNRTSDLGGYDAGALLDLLDSLPSLEGTGYTDTDREQLAAGLAPDEGPPPPTALTDVDAIPPVADADAPTVSELGDLWHLGPHRLLCGDSTVRDDVARVLAALDEPTEVVLVHADPPYGMGKEADGVLNDNLYGPKLDAFQCAWWGAWLPQVAENGSAYIWGTAPDLWRLWYAGGLGDDDALHVRNEIVWDKGSGMGMRSAGHHSYPTATERCLFLMRGQQFLGSQNLEDFWEGYEPLRAWLCSERDAAGWTNGDINRITGTQMAGHWFTRSQFMPISERHYSTLAAAADGRAFTKGYDDLFAEMFPDLRDGGNSHRRELAEALREGRSYFDNTHDSMTDVWRFTLPPATEDLVTDIWRYPRVHGSDRHGHATPKPVAMVQRAFATSSRPGDVIAVPFGGSGPEFIAAHHLDRLVVAIELEPRFVDVIARRYQEHTGTVPLRQPAAGGELTPHDFRDQA